MKRILLTILLLVLTSSSFAQTSRLGGFRRGFATVVFAGLGGAVLGLSTLSFYGTPQEHTSNIWTGLGIGIFGGAAYLAMGSSQDSSRNEDVYGLIDRKHLPMKTPESRWTLLAYDF